MRVLFLHNNFPAQYRHIARLLAADRDNQVVFATSRREGTIPGVEKVLYKPARAVRAETHHYVRSLESAVLAGQAVYRITGALKQRGFVPDLVCGHSGWGPTFYVKDAFPDAKLLCYFEWYYRARGTDADFLPDSPIGADDACRIRTRNAPILLDLAECDWGQSPTRWQSDQFPEVFRSKISVLHDGVDTDYFQPEAGAKLVLPDLDLASAREIVTYVARGMEPYRGFPQFMAAAALLLARRPDCHVVVVGEDRVAYGRKLGHGQTYQQKMLAELDLDRSRIHFTGPLPYGQYRQVLRASSVHVYLTVPFVLSWSMIEALATGCLVVASDTAPVREVIADGRNGLLVDFFAAERLADRVAEGLDHPDRFAEIRAAARRTVLERYDLRDRLADQRRLIEAVANGNLPAAAGAITGRADAAPAASQLAEAGAAC